MSSARCKWQEKKNARESRRDSPCRFDHLLGKTTRLLSNQTQHVYEVRPRKDKRGVDLISDALPFGGLWYGEPDAISNAVDYAKFYSRSRKALIRVFDESGTVIETHEHKGDFQEPRTNVSGFR
jgi:hypothetical protein